MTSNYTGELGKLARNIGREDIRILTKSEKSDISAALRRMDDAAYDIVGAVKSLQYAEEGELSEEFARLMHSSSLALAKAEKILASMGNYECDNDGINPLNSGTSKTESYLHDLNFEVFQEEFGIRFTMNQALPNMKTAGNQLLRYKSQLEDVLDAWLHECGSQIDKQDNAYMVFVHHYNKDKRYCMRDCDNYYEKPLSDILSRRFLKNGDSCHYVQRCSFTEADSRTFTEVFLIRFEAFPEWISGRIPNP